MGSVHRSQPVSKGKQCSKGRSVRNSKPLPKETPKRTNVSRRPKVGSNCNCGAVYGGLHNDSCIAHSTKPRQGYEHIKMPTRAENEQAIEKIHTQWPMLTWEERTLLHILRKLGDCAMRYQNSNGGGRYPAYVAYLRSKYRIKLFF